MPTFDASAQATPAATLTVSWTHVLGAGANRKVVVGTHGESNDATAPVVAGITFDTVAMTFVAAIDHRPAARSQRSEIWFIDEADLPVAGSYTVVATFGQAADTKWGNSVSLTNAAQGAPEQNATGVSALTSITTAITTLTNNAMLIDTVGFGTSTGTDLVPNQAGQTQRQEVQASEFDAALSTRVVAAAGASAMGWTGGAALRCAQVIVSVADNAPPAGNRPNLLLLGVG